MKHDFIEKIMFSLSASFGYYLGGFDKALEVLILFAFIDYISGVFKAFKNKQLSSKIGAKGIMKKVLYFLIIAVAVALDYLLATKGMLRTLILYTFIANEGLSIFENVAEFGIKIPTKLTEALKQIQDKTKDEK